MSFAGFLGDKGRNLTDRECAKIIGALLGSLCSMADPEDVRRAIEYWNSDESWEKFNAISVRREKESAKMAILQPCARCHEIHLPSEDCA